MLENVKAQPETNLIVLAIDGGISLNYVNNLTVEEFEKLKAFGTLYNDWCNLYNITMDNSVVTPDDLISKIRIFVRQFGELTGIFLTEAVVTEVIRLRINKS